MNDASPEPEKRSFQYYIWVHLTKLPYGAKEEIVYSYLEHLEKKKVSDGFTTYVNENQYLRVTRELSELREQLRNGDKEV